MAFNRRDFLKSLGATFGARSFVVAGLSPIFSSVIQAMEEEGDPQARFVLIRVHGSMDSTVGLHPHTLSNAGIDEQDLFLGYDPLKDVKAEGAISVGPSATEILTFARKMAIVRGIYVGPNDLGHPFAIQHMTSGRTQESAPAWTATIGSRYSKLGYVVSNAPLLRGTLPPFSSLATSVLRAEAEAVIRSAGGSGLSLYENSTLGVNRLLEFQSKSSKLGKFMEIFHKSKDVTTGKVSDADIVVACLYSNLARVAQIDIDATNGLDSLDTHTNHAKAHAPAQADRWKIISKFLRSLEELELLDKTLVVVVTEFNRTPGLNDNGGKDHNYSDNAVALFGRRIRGGTVVGDRSLYKRADGFPYAYWAGKHIDFGYDGSPGTGQTVNVAPGDRSSDGVDLIRPGDMWKSVAASFDQKTLNYAAKTDRVIPGLFE